MKTTIHKQIFLPGSAQDNPIDGDRQIKIQTDPNNGPGKEVCSFIELKYSKMRWEVVASVAFPVLNISDVLATVKKIKTDYSR